ncbi:MAG: hypothetical protein ABI282_01280 [Candidatus Baltobacteraceae bacterium]
MTGLLVLGVFLIFASMMFARWMPAILAVPLMAFAMSVVAGVPFAAIGALIVAGASSLSSVYVAVIFGALLGRVTIDTGIARAIVNLAAEYGGEQPFVLALVLCAVVALLFTSLSGLGAIIMVGSIVLPIMMTTGVPRRAAATLFLMAFALGFIFNIVNWKFYTQFFGVVPEAMTRYAMVLALIDAVALVVYAIVAFRSEWGYATWAVRAERVEPDGVPPWALLTPVLPIVLYYALHLDATIAFIISALYGVLVTRRRAAIPTLVAAAIRGVEDVAPAILLFIGIGMLLTLTKAPQFSHALEPLVAGGWTHSPIAYVVIFGLLSPLVVYRGPLNPFGVGIAIFTILLTSHSLPPVILVAAVMAVVQVQNVCDPTNTANVWVANFTGVQIDEITKRTLPFQVAVATAATLAVVFAAPSLFGVKAFAAIVAPAYASANPGLFANPSSAGRIAVGNDGTALGRAAAEATIAAFSGEPWHAFARNDAPNVGGCSAKPYAATVQITTSTFRLVEGTDLDVGLRLEDCGGWIVNEWHDHATEPGYPTSASAATLAREGISRLVEWVHTNPARANALFVRGLAAIPADPPSYFYTLFKTVDGNMRAYVRAGGPAYDAGLRTNDVVDTLDGRYWWMYGTYQTQLRAYDGLPHRFQVERGNQTLDIQLGAPYDASTSGKTL